MISGTGSIVNLGTHLGVSLVAPSSLASWSHQPPSSGSLISCPSLLTSETCVSSLHQCSLASHQSPHTSSLRSVQTDPKQDFLLPCLYLLCHHTSLEVLLAPMITRVLPYGHLS